MTSPSARPEAGGTCLRPSALTGPSECLISGETLAVLGISKKSMIFVVLMSLGHLITNGKAFRDIFASVGADGFIRMFDLR